MRTIFACILIILAPLFCGSVRIHIADEQVKAVVVQFDSRQPMPSEHEVLTAFNRRYFSNLPGHRYVFFDKDSFQTEDAESLKISSPSQKEDCESKSKEYTVGPDGCILHAAWGKVKAMVKATEMYPQAEYFLYMDSDMAFNYKYNRSSFSVTDLYSGVASANGENMFYVAAAPWITEVMLEDTSYRIGINSGALLWKAGKEANDALRLWWKSSADDYDFGVAPQQGFRQQFRWEWPWEQNRLTAIMNEPAYRDTGILFSSVPSRENFHILTGAKQCEQLIQFVAEVPYQEDYACPLLHYTGVGGMRNENEIVKRDIGEMRNLLVGL